jgi:cytochrome c-type biogenesis protein CcmH
MRRRALLVALVLVLGGASGILVDGAGASSDHPSAAELEGELVCPTCKTTLDESDAPVARRMKAYIRRRIAEGATGKEIKDELVAQFGKGVLSTPPKSGFDLLAWLLPIGGIGLGAVVLAGLAWAWSRSRDDDGRGPPSDDALDPELERRVDEELARFDV